jgi:HEAT repeat protein
VPIKRSSAASIEALATDLLSESVVTREAAVARLTVIGARAVDALAALAARHDGPAPARAAALRALEAIGDARSLDTVLEAAQDQDEAVAVAAVAAARVFLEDRRASAVLDRLTAIALDRSRPAAVRLAAIAAVSGLKPGTLKPLWEALANDPHPAVRNAVDAPPGQRVARTSAADQLLRAADTGLPENPETLRRLLTTAGAAAPLPALHRIVERLRERESSSWANARGDWARVRATAHLALAKRSSRLALYDLRETIEHAASPIAVEFLTALSMAGDASCLEAIAAAHGRATDAWWRRHLSDTFQAIVSREHLTRRHAVMKRIEKRWGGLPA